MSDGWGGRFRGLRRRTLFAGALLAILVLVGSGLAIYAARALSRFERVEARRSTVLYAAPPVLRPGVHVGALDLAGILSRVGYRETRNPGGPGQFSPWAAFLVRSLQPRWLGPFGHRPVFTGGREALAGFESRKGR